MDKTFHLIFRSNLWILLLEENNHIVTLFDKQDKEKAVKYAVDYAEAAGGKLLIHFEDGNVHTVLNPKYMKENE
ncbi:MAG: DUF2188 domain-containing protein [Bacteroidota bacterium]